MKTKYFFVYLALGAAFLGVSLWVWLSGGKNARAVNAKYRLGGMMLSTWALLSAAGCGTTPGGNPVITCYEPAEPDPQVMCYDVAMPEQTENISAILFMNGGDGTELAGNGMKAGDFFHVTIQNPTYAKFALTVTRINEEGTLLFKELISKPEGANSITADIALPEEIDWKGEACVNVQGVEQEDPEVLTNMCFAVRVVNLL